MDVRSERGQTMAEYAILLGILSIALLATLLALGGTVSGLYQTTIDAISDLV